MGIKTQLFSSSLANREPGIIEEQIGTVRRSVSGFFSFFTDYKDMISDKVSTSMEHSKSNYHLICVFLFLYSHQLAEGLVLSLSLLNTNTCFLVNFISQLKENKQNHIFFMIKLLILLVNKTW